MIKYEFLGRDCTVLFEGTTEAQSALRRKKRREEKDAISPFS
jgi:hypothetical protein